MHEDLVTALARVDDAFASYPRRAVLDGCPHCAGETQVHEHDLFSLTIKLGNTVGDRHDVKSLLPLLLRRLTDSDALDADIVLGKLAQEEWRTWPAAEQEAVEQYLDALWHALLADFPSKVGAFVGAEDFLAAVERAGVGAEQFLAAWDGVSGAAADRHLALLLNDFDLRARRANPVVVAWLRREDTRSRLLAAFERDLATSWADEFADAHDRA
ncbi:hypothetical protein [Allokutzneria sp. NRRL B-24872]|uniref:hypothetical protein n=1 Tax=Allokutzneria sp. NRRL B-24872 TaxID=1137961 RepID=UPI000A3C65D7|nr:hypothetical protein [Allokutzneria sp. NRRL B-24872]